MLLLIAECLSSQSFGFHDPAVRVDQRLQQQLAGTVTITVIMVLRQKARCVSRIDGECRDGSPLQTVKNESKNAFQKALILCRSVLPDDRDAVGTNRLSSRAIVRPLLLQD